MLEQLLEGAAQLDTPELKNFLSKVGLLLANRQESALSASETELIQKINQGLPIGTQQRYDELQTKLRNETIMPEEHQALLALVDVIEQASAERLKYLIALSQLRQVSLDNVMEQLEIKPPAVYV